MIRTTNCCLAWFEARKYFGIENNPDLVLHHKDESLKYDNPERYNEWRPEDLVVMTRSEHTSHHFKGKSKDITEETRLKISNTLTGYKHTDEAKYNIGKGHWKKIQCVETGVIYDSIKDATDKLGRNPTYSLQTGGKTLGLHFIYL